MKSNQVEWQHELEESAHGVDLFRPPGAQLQIENAHDQAVASGWIPEGEEVDSPPSSRLSRAQILRIELRDSMEELEDVCARAAAAQGWLASLESSMNRLHRALGRHIAEVESPTGLLVEIAEVTPRLAADIARIRNEHAELVRSTNRVFKGLERGAEANVTLLRATVLTLLGDLALHRQHGSDLVYDAYNMDIAAGD